MSGWPREGDYVTVAPRCVFIIVIFVEDPRMLGLQLLHANYTRGCDIYILRLSGTSITCTLNTQKREL